MTSIWLSADLALFPSHEILSYPKTFRHTRSCLTPRPSDTRDSVLPQDLQSHEILSYPKTFSHTRFFLSQDLQSHEILSYPKTFSHTRFCLTPRPSVTRDSVLPQDRSAWKKKTASAYGLQITCPCFPCSLTLSSGPV